MAGTRRNATNVHDSIEAKVDDDRDISMDDDDEGEEVDADGEPDNEEDADGEPDNDADMDDEDEESDDDEDVRPRARARGRGRAKAGSSEAGAGAGVARNWFHQIDRLQKWLTEYSADGDTKLAQSFQRLPAKHILPDYYDVITHPVSFGTIRKKLVDKEYTEFNQFVRDIAQICHNAQVYNLPSAPISKNAVQLRQLFQQELKKLVGKGAIRPDEAVLPDLGEIPPAEDVDNDDEDDDDEDEDDQDDEEEDEEDEEEDEEDSEDQGARRRGRASRKPDPHKRGRPPKLFSPTQARINALLKGLRKFKDEDGDPYVLPFDKLPDKIELPDYYEVIDTPMALDMIKTKMKRKKYPNLDAAVVDLELMFENAKTYNEDGSEIFDAAVELQKQTRVLAAHEKGRPDDDFRDEEGKLPLSEIHHNGQTYRVGDWVHIRNANKETKPIVAQIFRTWQDKNGQLWVNACWYYRPEQTVHRAEKHFYEYEVAKTGQYCDHPIRDVLDKCFVMYVTKYFKGRPRELPRDKTVYLCESRYNEHKRRFFKIKTWGSCLPDEVRDRDYAMDMYPQPLNARKMPSPIKHMLPPNAKPNDPLPKPTMGAPNAPPIVGAVHRRPREANESPPPDPAAAMPPNNHQGMPDPTRRLSAYQAQHHGQVANGSPMQYSNNQMAAPGPSPSPIQFNHHFVAQVPPQQQQQQFQQPQPQQQHQFQRQFSAAASPMMHHQQMQPQQQQQQHFQQQSPGTMYQTPHQQQPMGYSQQGQQQGRPMYAQQQQQQQGYQQAPPGNYQQQGYHPQQQPIPQQHHQPAAYPHGAPQGGAVPPHYQNQAQPPPQSHPQQMHLPMQQQNHLQPTAANSPASYNYHQNQFSATPGRAPMASPNQAPAYANGAGAMSQQQQQPQHAQAPVYNAQPQPRTNEVFTLDDETNAMIPEKVRDVFHTDDKGRVIFYDTPPVVRPNNGGVSQKYHGLGHSAKYLDGLAEWKAERARKRKEREEEEAANEAKRKTAEAKKAKEVEQEWLKGAEAGMTKLFNAYNADTAAMMAGQDEKSGQEQGLPSKAPKAQEA